jgi:hypothetical protein
MSHDTAQKRPGFPFLLIFLLAPSAWAQHSSATGPATPIPTTYEICRQPVAEEGGTVRTHRITTYLSGISVRAHRENDADYVSAFSAYLASKYGVKGTTPDCVSELSQAEAQRALEMWMTDRPQLVTYVQTGWTYSPNSGQQP